MMLEQEFRELKPGERIAYHNGTQVTYATVDGWFAGNCYVYFADRASSNVINPTNRTWLDSLSKV